MRNVFLSDPDSGIGDRIGDKYLSVFLMFPLDKQSDRAFPGIFHGVCQKVYQNLLDPDLISIELCRKRRIHIHMEFKTLLLCPDPDHSDNIRKHGVKIVGRVFDLHLSGLQLAHIQNIVDDVQKQAAGGLDI